MRAFVIVLALTGLAMPVVMADPAPTQTPAQLQQSAPAAPAPGMASQQDKAAAEGFDVQAQNLDGIASPRVQPGLPSEILLRRPDVAHEADKSKQRAQLAAKTPAPQPSGDKKPSSPSEPQ